MSFEIYFQWHKMRYITKRGKKSNRLKERAPEFRPHFFVPKGILYVFLLYSVEKDQFFVWHSTVNDERK